MESSCYVKDYMTFIMYMDYREVLEAWARKNVPDLVRRVMKAGNPGDGELRILSIGPGAGVPDAAILNEICSLNHSVRYTGVEPNREFLKQFKANVALNPKYHQVDFQLREMRAEDFLTRGDHREKYHLILFIHSLYYIVDGVGSLLRGYLNMLHKGGHIVAITATEETGLCSFLRSFKGQIPRVDLTHAEDIESALKKEEIPFTRKPFEAILDIAPILEGTEDGDLILDFLTYIPHFRQVSPPSLVYDFLAKLKDVSFEHEKGLVCSNKSVVHMIPKESFL